MKVEIFSHDLPFLIAMVVGLFIILWQTEIIKSSFYLLLKS
jgi:hypothetical protein